MTADKNTPRIILASASPRRKQLLEQLAVNFVVYPSSIEEIVGEGVLPSEIVQNLSLQKARAVAVEHSSGIVIGSDTIVVVDDKIMGKPLNDKEALSMLLELQGREHQVYSGIALVDACSGKESVGFEVTSVEFRKILRDEVLRYIASGEPKGKAGAYAIQGLGAIFVKGIKGDYSNVVGLPVFLLAEMLQSFGVSIL